MVFVAVLAVCACAPSVVRGEEPIHGFVAPFRSIELASSESGIIREILVREGQSIKKGQMLARLDDELHQALLAISEEAQKAEGGLLAARAEQQLRQERVRKLEELLTRGSARPEEVERARADAAIAAAQLKSILEGLVIKKLEYERARIQLDRRRIRSPLDGVVVRIVKESGEYVGPSDPQLLTIVELDRLLAVFAVPSRVARQLVLNQPVQVRLTNSDQRVPGVVEQIAPVIDGRSGTMRVEIRIDNPDRLIFSGEPCLLEL